MTPAAALTRTAVNPRFFKTKIERMFRLANPDVAAAPIRWEHGPVRVTFADGSEGFSGVFIAAAGGYRVSKMVAAFSPTIGWSVR